jgi:hypothetical protein
VRNDGSPDRRHVSAKTKADAALKVRRLEKRYAEASVRKDVAARIGGLL